MAALRAIGGERKSMRLKRMTFGSAIFVGLLWACLASVTAAQTLNIASGPEAVSPLQAGDRAPAFTVYDVDGDAVRFDPAHLDGPVLLITFRGGWCPYCNAQLAGLRRVLPEIRSGGVEVLFMSGDRPELLFSSLQQDTQDGIEGLDYRILSDANMQAASALGIAYRVADGTHEAYEARGRDMGDSSIALHTALPLPSVFMIDPNGQIAFAYSNPDIRVRLPEDQVLAAAQPYMHQR
jgi:peroxiredoxin